MFPNPITLTNHTAHSDTLLRRLLGGISLFADDSAAPDHMPRSSGRRGFALILERLPRFCRSVVLVRDTETRQEHLFAICGLDGAR
jgi:hypothetical protein